MMGMWFLASAYGQYVAGLLGAGMSAADPNATNLDKLVLLHRRLWRARAVRARSPGWS